MDQSWCLASEIDLGVSYLGGSRSLISSVLSESKLDAVLVDPNERTSWLADLLKPVIEKPADMMLRPGFESRPNLLAEIIRLIKRS